MFATVTESRRQGWLRSILWGGGLVLLVVLLGGFLFWILVSRPVIEIPGPSRMEVRAVTYGPTHQFVYGRPWEELAYAFLPDKFLEEESGGVAGMTYRRYEPFEGRKVIFEPEADSLVLWVVHDHPNQSPTSYERSFQVVALNQGEPFGAAELHQLNRIGDRTFLAWELKRFPRRESEIELKVLERRGGWEPLGRFSVSNPAPRNHPEWNPKPLPATKGDDRLSVTLTDLQTGRNPRYGMPYESHFKTRIGFVVRTNGEPTTAWTPRLKGWLDATGNRKDDWDGALYDDINFEQAKVYGGLTGLGEPWKIRIGLWAGPEAQFEEEDLIKVEDFRFGRGTPMAVSRELHGVTVDIQNNTKERYSSEQLLEVRLRPPEDDLNVAVAHAETAAGDPIRFDLDIHNTEEKRFWFEPEEELEGEPRLLDLTIAVYEPPELEFIVEPTQFSPKWVEPTKEDLPNIIEGLQSDDRNIRWHAAEALKDLGAVGSEAVPVLTEALSDPSPKVRKSAAYALGRIGEEAAPATDELIERLDDRERLIRSAAARSLGQIGASPETAVPALMRVLESDSWTLLGSAVQSLGDFGSEAAMAAPKLLELLETSDSFKREILTALTNIGPDPEIFIPKAVNLLESDDEELRRQAAYAIGTIGTGSEETVRKLVKLAANTKRSESRHAAIRALAELGSSGEEAVPMLEDLAVTGPPFLRIEAAAALYQMEAEATARSSFETLLNDPEPDVRVETIRRLTKLEVENEKLYSVLAERLTDEEARVQRAALNAFERSGAASDKAVKAVVACLENDEDRVVRKAARTLAVLGADGGAAEKAVPRLRRMLDQTRPRDQYPILLALWRLESKEKDFQRFVELLKTEKQRAMFHLLKRIGSPAQPFAPILKEIQRETSDARLDERIDDVLDHIEPDEAPASKEARR